MRPYLSRFDTCLLYTSDAADEEDSVDLGGRRIIKKNDAQGQGRRARGLRTKSFFLCGLNGSIFGFSLDLLSYRKYDRWHHLFRKLKTTSQ